MVEKPAVRLPGGSVVDIVDRDEQWVGRGFYNGHSRIALRVLTADPAEAIDADFFTRRLVQAVSLRRELLGLDGVTNAYRLVHSEGDGLSGLVVDRFGSTLVLEFFAAGMYRFRSAIQDALAVHFPESRFYWFAEEHVQKQESFDCREPEPPPPEVITEHGVRFRVALGPNTRRASSSTSATTGASWHHSAAASACSICVATRAASPSTPRRWAAWTRWSVSISTSRRWAWRRVHADFPERGLRVWSTGRLARKLGNRCYFRRSHDHDFPPACPGSLGHRPSLC
jgi:hypothetical protein